MQVTSDVREPLVTGGKTLKDVTNDICRQVEGRPSRSWIIAFVLALITLA
jgi:hypothetical protein